MIGLRDRYSGSLDSGKKIHYFNTSNTNGNLKITTEGLKTLLNKKIPGKEFTDKDCELILALCVHRHTTLSSVASYPSNLANMFSDMGLSTDKQDLIALKNQLNQNVNRLGSYAQDYIMLANGNLKFMDLSGAILSGAILSRADLRGVDLRGADLRGADLSGADLRRAHLSGANLRGAKLQEAKLRRANLSGANLQGAKLRGAKLQGAIFDDKTQIILKFSTSLDLAGLDLDFNHINNESGTILTAINSIDNIYKDLKNKLMIQVFQHLKEKDINSIQDALSDILFNSQSDYTDALNQEPKFRDKLFQGLYSKGNNGALLLKEEEVIMFMSLLQKMTEEDLKKFTSDNNGFFIQLIHQAYSIADNVADAVNLYKKYLSLHGIIKINEDESFTFNIVCMESMYYADEDFLKDTFIFINNDNKLIISAKYLDKFLYHKPIKENEQSPEDVNWDNVFRLSHNKSQVVGDTQLEKLFDIFKVFKANYMFELNNAKFIKLLNLLKLGNYTNEFVTAIGKKVHKQAYTDENNQKEFKKIFNAYFQPVMDNENSNTEPCDLAGVYAKDRLNIKEDHIQNIFATYEFTNKNNNEKAKLLLLLSGIFATYSSSSFFGKEYDSPTALRYYAYGLMKAAQNLDNTIIPQFNKEDDKWENKFLGIGEAFTCTALLSVIILGHCKKFIDYGTLLSGIMPPAWA